MQTLSKFIKKNIIIISVIIARSIAQIIFGFLYNPHANKIFGIPNNGWARQIIQSGYIQIQQESHINNNPYPITDNIITTTNTHCIYGQGNCQIFAFQYLLAAIKRLNTIQFIAQNSIANTPNDTSNRLMTIVRLSPHRSFPYIFGMTMGPTNDKNPNNKDNSILSQNNTIQLGELGIQYLCDAQKIKKIKSLTYSEFLKAVQIKDPNLRSPCQDYRLPHMLAFNYFYYLQDSKKASLYYMIAAFHDDVPSISVSMPAIVLGYNGDNMTSASLRYDRMQYTIHEYNNTNDPKHKQQLLSLIDRSLKKSVSEISLFILSQTYPQGLTGDTKINRQEIGSTIQSILSDCKHQRIACEIITLGLQHQRIQKNGIMTYPIDDTKGYRWNTEKKLWEIRDKERT